MSSDRDAADGWRTRHGHAAVGPNSPARHSDRISRHRAASDPSAPSTAPWHSARGAVRYAASKALISATDSLSFTLFQASASAWMRDRFAARRWRYRGQRGGQDLHNDY